jgi:hypothetical protein
MRSASDIVASMGVSLSLTDEQYLTSKQENEQPSSLFHRISDWFGKKRAAELKQFETMTRQRIRRTRFERSFASVSQAHPDIPRAIRRSIARDILKRERAQKAAA